MFVTSGSVRLLFPLVWVQDYGREKSSGVGGDGHDVLLISHIPMLHHTPPTPRVGGWGREGGWALGGWGIRRILCTYAYIETCGYQDYSRKKNGDSKNPNQI